jgi:hypothetical protein
VQVPVTLDKGMVIAAFVSVPTTLPAVSVSFPLMVPTALSTPFTTLMLVTVSVPVKVPTPAIVCMIAVVNDPPADGARAAGIADAGAAITIAGITTSSSASKIARLLFCIFLFPPVILNARGPGRSDELASHERSGEVLKLTSSEGRIWREENPNAAVGATRKRVARRTSSSPSIGRC